MIAHPFQIDIIVCYAVMKEKPIVIVLGQIQVALLMAQEVISKMKVGIQKY